MIYRITSLGKTPFFKDPLQLYAWFRSVEANSDWRIPERLDWYQPSIPKSAVRGGMTVPTNHGHAWLSNAEFEPSHGQFHCTHVQVHTR